MLKEKAYRCGDHPLVWNVNVIKLKCCSFSVGTYGMMLFMRGVSILLYHKLLVVYFATHTSMC
jgi:hypothetical protein